MTESYIVYLKNTSNKIFESDSLDKAAAYVDRLDYERRMRGDFETEKYEIVRVVK